MSHAQERRRAEMWEAVHKEYHEKSIDELQKIKAKLDAMDQSTQEYIALKKDYDSKYETAESFFMKFYES